MPFNHEQVIFKTQISVIYWVCRT